MQIGAANMESCMQITQKIKKRTTYDPAVWFLVIKKLEIKKNTYTKSDICMSISIAALFTVAKIWKQPKCPSVHQ